MVQSLSVKEERLRLHMMRTSQEDYGGWDKLWMSLRVQMEGSEGLSTSIV